MALGVYACGVCSYTYSTSVAGDTPPLVGKFAPFRCTLTPVVSSYGGLLLLFLYGVIDVIKRAIKLVLFRPVLVEHELFVALGELTGVFSHIR